MRYLYIVETLSVDVKKRTLILFSSKDRSLFLMHLSMLSPRVGGGGGGGGAGYPREID